jgi:hypothetical protein
MIIFINHLLCAGYFSFFQYETEMLNLFSYLLSSNGHDITCFSVFSLSSVYLSLLLKSIIFVCILSCRLFKIYYLDAPICKISFWLTGKFRHLPVVENGEVIALLDITKCLYDAISRMEKAAEQGSAIAAAVEGVERQWGSNFSGWLISSQVVV